MTKSDNFVSLWEILVPTVRNSGVPFKTRYHRVWDAKIRAISGGLTIVPPVIGQWINPEEDNKLYKERMIPVQIACTEKQILEIMDITKKYYSQEKVFARLLSEKVLIR